MSVVLDAGDEDESPLNHPISDSSHSSKLSKQNSVPLIKLNLADKPKFRMTEQNLT